jgi:hypothetical protein
MAYEVEVERAFRALQGLPSPVRRNELEDRSFGSRTRYRAR